MGATKTEHFTDKQNAIATLAKALGHPARIAIRQLHLWGHRKRVATCTADSFTTLKRTQKRRTNKRKH